MAVAPGGTLLEILAMVSQVPGHPESVRRASDHQEANRLFAQEVLLDDQLVGPARRVGVLMRLLL